MLMDVRMPVLDGIEATRRITASRDAPKVIILTTFELDEYVFEALRAGASGFLLKRTEPAQLTEAIRVVAGGDALLSPSITRRLIEEFTRRPQVGSNNRVSDLTDREREVLLLIARGLSEPGTRRAPLHRRQHRQDPCQTHIHKTGCPGPRPGDRDRLRKRPGPVRN